MFGTAGQQRRSGGARIDTDWNKLLYVWMHDPVDKALDVRRHKQRAARYVSSALGRRVPYGEIDEAVGSADAAAAVADRIPMPSAGSRGERAVGPVDGRLKIRHPVSGESCTLDGLTLNESAVIEVIEEIVRELPLDSPRKRFFALWRLLPERLAETLGQDYARLPADTRVPDHSLFQHADIASGIAAGQQGRGGYAYLSVSIGPVQEFVAASRSVRDLWSGSALLSWLLFQGMRPVLDNLGPTAFVFPALRGNALADLWLREDAGLADLVPLPSREARTAPAIPNRFLALIPWGPEGAVGRNLAQACEQAVRDGWRAVAKNVHQHVGPVFCQLDPGWDMRWSDQIENYFDIAVSLLPERPLTDECLANLVGGRHEFGEVWEDAGKVRDLDQRIRRAERYGFPQVGAGRWQAQMELSARLMEAQRAVRHIPVLTADPPTPPKCSLLGTFEQMGPADLGASSDFWKHAQGSSLRLRERERFCAIALCKRFAAERLLYRALAMDVEDQRFPDTATVAAAAWLHRTPLDISGWWNGRWLHQRSRNDVEPGEEAPPTEVWGHIKRARGKLGNPPSYYALLVMDADNMGRWLKGEYAPEVAEVLHPRLSAYYSQLDGADLSVRRPVGPALHAAISEALNNFASVLVPRIVKKYHGTLIYSGGDDVMALIPARVVLSCADELRRSFQGSGHGDSGWTVAGGRPYLTMGSKATLSAGLAIVHYKHDLRHALDAARQAEKASKENGRNRVTMRILRRSGGRPSIELKWDHLPWLQSIVDAFAGGASDRWLYTLRRELPALGYAGMPPPAVEAEIRRLVRRSQDFEAPCPSDPAHDSATWWKSYCSLVPHGKASVESFTQLCLGASFIARGQEE